MEDIIRNRHIAYNEHINFMSHLYIMGAMRAQKLRNTLRILCEIHQVHCIAHIYVYTASNFNSPTQTLNLSSIFCGISVCGLFNLWRTTFLFCCGILSYVSASCNATTKSSIPLWIKISTSTKFTWVFDWNFHVGDSKLLAVYKKSLFDPKFQCEGEVIT